MRRAFLLQCAILAALAGAPAHSEEPPVDSPARLQWRASGQVYAFLSSRIDYVGMFRTEVGAPGPGGGRAWIESTIPVLSASGRGALVVEDLDYQARALWRLEAREIIWAPFAGARGSEGVDREVSRLVSLAGIQIAPRASGRRLSWSLEAAAVLSDEGLEARAAAAARGEWLFVNRPGWSAGMLAAWDGLWVSGPSDLLDDRSAGFFLRLRDRDGLALTASATYYRGRHPLGLEDTGVLAGFEIAGGASPAHPDESAVLRAALEAGGGNDRVRARQILDLQSTPWKMLGRPWRARILADNALDAGEHNDLYYIVDGGLEAAAGALRPGLFWHHRSGHLLGEPNDLRLSLNVVEAGLRTPGWLQGIPGSERPSGWRRLEGEIRLGAVVTSEFGEHQSWSARGGIVWSLPVPWDRLSPFVGVRGTLGEVRGWSASTGVQIPPGASIILAAERDGQLFEPRRTAWTLTAARRF
jgi:hypothetical protein